MIDTPDTAVDPRPRACRNRLREEGKPYPKLGCAACGASIRNRIECGYLEASPAGTPDMILREEAERMAQARVTAALRKAASVAFNACLVPPDGGSPTEAEAAVCNEACNRILALIPDSGAAFDRAIAEAVKAEREKCARVADAMQGAGSQAVAKAIRARTEGEG